MATTLIRARRAGGWRFAKKAIVDAFTYTLMTAVAITTIGPFIVMTLISLTKDAPFISFPPRIPRPFSLWNFQLLFSRTMILRWLLNSFYATGMATLGTIVTSSMAGYAFARGRFWGRNVLFTMFLGSLMVPMSAMIVPLYVFLSQIHLIDTYWALIGPSFASIFGTFFLRQQYLAIPADYDDAAFIDGATKFQVYFNVLLPQIKPALATLAVLRFMGHWNDFLYPMIVTSKGHLRTLTVGLGTVARLGGGSAGRDMAGAVIGFLPTFLIFMAGQRYIIQGVSLTGVKG